MSLTRFWFLKFDICFIANKCRICLHFVMRFLFMLITAHIEWSNFTLSSIFVVRTFFVYFLFYWIVFQYCAHLFYGKQIFWKINIFLFCFSWETLIRRFSLKLFLLKKYFSKFYDFGVNCFLSSVSIECLMHFTGSNGPYVWPSSVGGAVDCINMCVAMVR